jgi:hypothetical protein
MMKKIICILLPLMLAVALIGCATEGTDKNGTNGAHKETEAAGDLPGGTTDAPRETTAEPQETADGVAGDETTVTTAPEPAVSETTAPETDAPPPIDTGFPNEAESEGTKRY